MDVEDWISEFQAFIELTVPKEQLETKGMNFIKYAIAAARLEITIDGNTTFKSALDKIRKAYQRNNTSSTPLKDFYNYLWINEDLNFGEYVRKLRKKSQFIKNN